MEHDINGFLSTLYSEALLRRERYSKVQYEESNIINDCKSVFEKCKGEINTRVKSIMMLNKLSKKCLPESKTTNDGTKRKFTEYQNASLDDDYVYKIKTQLELQKSKKKVNNFILLIEQLFKQDYILDILPITHYLLYVFPISYLLSNCEKTRKLFENINGDACKKKLFGKNSIIIELNKNISDEFAHINSKNTKFTFLLRKLEKINGEIDKKIKCCGYDIDIIFDLIVFIRNLTIMHTRCENSNDFNAYAVLESLLLSKAKFETIQEIKKYILRHYKSPKMFPIFDDFIQSDIIDFDRYLFKRSYNKIKTIQKKQEKHNSVKILFVREFMNINFINNYKQNYSVIFVKHSNDNCSDDMKFKCLFCKENVIIPLNDNICSCSLFYVPNSFVNLFDHAYNLIQRTCNLLLSYIDYDFDAEVAASGSEYNISNANIDGELYFEDIKIFKMMLFEMFEYHFLFPSYVRFQILYEVFVQIMKEYNIIKKNPNSKVGYIKNVEYINMVIKYKSKCDVLFSNIPKDDQNYLPIMDTFNNINECETNDSITTIKERKKIANNHLYLTKTYFIVKHGDLFVESIYYNI